MAFGSRPSPVKVSAMRCWLAITSSLIGKIPYDSRFKDTARTDAGKPIEELNCSATASILFRVQSSASLSASRTTSTAVALSVRNFFDEK